MHTDTAARSELERFGFGVPWEDVAAYAQAVRAGDLLFVSGQLSHDEDGRFVGEGDIALQAETTLANLDRVLQRFGAGREDIAAIEVFLVDLRGNWPAASAAFRRFFGDLRPANSSFGVVELVLPEQLIEIAATVVLPRRDGTA